MNLHRMRGLLTLFLQKKYLAQIYNIAPEYPRAVYDLLPEKKRQFEFSEVEELSKDAQTFSKEPKFRPGENDRLVGMPPGMSVYGM